MAAIREANDNELRTLIHKNDHVIVMFIDDDCEICKTLAPKFEAIANKPTNSHVLFLRLDAKENPVSSKEVKLSGTPFFATYYKGVLQECGLLEKEEGIEKMLSNLTGTS